MVNQDKIFGRLSNRMFQMAAFLSWCWDNNIHFFVQDEKYFKKYEKEIRQLYGDGIDQRNKGYVGIHVRRAKNPINPDEPAYSENPFYANLMHHLHEDMSDNYYVKAMDYFKQLDPSLKFKVFSDDITWCMRQEMFKDCEMGTSAYSGVKDAEVVVRGVGSGREPAIRAFMANGIEILSIKDATPVPHNGPKAKKPRRV